MSGAEAVEGSGGVWSAMEGEGEREEMEGEQPLGTCGQTGDWKGRQKEWMAGWPQQAARLESLTKM